MCHVHHSGRLPFCPLSIRQSSQCTPSDEQDIVNQVHVTDFILLHRSSFLIREFGVGNEIGGHQLLCEVPDDLIVAARHTLWKSILDERAVSKMLSRWSDHLTFAGVNQKVTTAIG